MIDVRHLDGRDWIDRWMVDRNSGQSDAHRKERLCEIERRYARAGDQSCQDQPLTIGQAAADSLIQDGLVCRP